MKTPLPVILILALLFSAASVNAEIVNYPGYDLDNPYRVLPYEYVPPVPNSLFPHNDWNNNTVTVNGNVPGHVFGGIAVRDAGRPNAAGNTVNIQGGTIGSSTGTNGNVTGGWTDFGSVNTNTINITGNSTIYGIVFGGWINGGNGSATGNSVTTSTGTSSSGVILRGNVYGAYTQGGSAASEISNNIVTIDGSYVWKLDAIIAGAYSALNQNRIFDNKVIINADTNIRRAAIYGGRGQGNSTITDNTVTVNGGTIGSFGTGSTIYGGNNFNGSGEVTGNTVNIISGTVNAAIYGGASTSGVATNNIVNISGGVLNGSNLYGGSARSGVDAFTNNTLNVSSVLTANSAQNFQLINFDTIGGDIVANIGTLNTTPTGSAQTGVLLTVTDTNVVNFTGNIIGTGSLTKTGAGTFRLSADSSIDIDKALEIQEGLLWFRTGDINTLQNHITFAGMEDKLVVVSGVEELKNSFRTQTGAGDQNTLLLQGESPENPLVITETDGGAFYVAGGTGMTVHAGNLFLEDNGAYDLYVASGGEFNLHTYGLVQFYTGIDGDGTFNIFGTALPGMVTFSNLKDSPANTFRMGEINVDGTGGQVSLNLSNGASAERVLLQTDSFTVTNAMLEGGAKITANTIAISDSIISPDNWYLGDGSRTTGTLTLEAPTVTLKDFWMLYSANAPNLTGIPTTNSLLEINNTNPVNITGTNLIAVTTIGGQAFVPGEYLIMTTTNGFVGGDPTGTLRLMMDSFVVAPEDDSPRGGYTFVLGDDSEIGGSVNDIWLKQSLNSLTMGWMGGNSTWDDGEKFLSRQVGTSGEREECFLPGDKVYIGGNADIELKNNVTVSGLVAGLNSDETPNAGNVTFSGAGGITSDKASAFGDYAEGGTGMPLMDENGKLEKYGSGTLTFQNTGGNFFMEGVDIYDGTIAINQANQLQVGSGAAITFLGNAVLESTDFVALHTPIVVENTFTATLNTQTNSTLLLGGALSGDGSVSKTGLGTLYVLNGVDYEPATFTLSAGTLAGSGTVKATESLNSIMIQGNLSPDGTHNLAGTPGSRFGMLTLQGSSIVLGNSSAPLPKESLFSMDFDVDFLSNGKDTNKDLLKLEPTSSPSPFISGRINFHGGLQSNTDYLIIQGPSGLSYGAYHGDINATLIPILNGVTIATSGYAAPTAEREERGIVSGDSPRGTVRFEYGNASGIQPPTSPDLGSVWLNVNLNSLTMNWAGGNGIWNHDQLRFASLQEGTNLLTGLPSDTEYNTTDLGYLRQHGILTNENFDTLLILVSEQGTYNEYRLRDIAFQHGDEVAFYNATLDVANAIEITVPDTVLASNMTVGKERAAGNPTPKDGYVTFTGAGSINVNGDYAFGIYKGDSLEADGMLHKYGSGTLSFENDGENNFAGGIHLYGGTLQFQRAEQIQVGSGAKITFEDSATLKPTDTVQLAHNIDIKDNVTATFDVRDAAVALLLSGEVSGQTGNIKKTGEGILQLSGSNGVVQKTDVEYGTFRITDAFGTDDLTVQRGGTLAGGGTINIGVAAIGNGAAGDTANGRISPDSAVFTPDNTAITGDDKFGTLTFVGQGASSSLTFEAGSVFEVDLAKDADGNLRNDLIVVKDATVNINSEAILHVTVDYWSGGSENVMIIDATQGSVGNTEAKFGEFLIDPLPRGVSLEQIGWLGSGFFLGVGYNSEQGFGEMCNKHNRREIGKTLDWFIENVDPGLQNVIDYLSGSGLTDEEVCKMLDQITGDLTPNAMMMALKEPWRYPFHRLQFGCPIHDRTQQQYWGEFTARYENIGYDDNAHSFTINRYGLAVGADQRITSNSIFGMTFQYSEPHLRQATGKVRVEDFEMGMYGLTRVADRVDVKSYLGYSSQRYRFDRTVAFMNEQLRGKTSGDTLSASVEMIRPIRVRQGVWLNPLAAVDFEQTWMQGYQESGGQTAQVYDKASLVRSMFRIGLNGDFNLQNGLVLKGRVQYGTQLNGLEYPVHGVRFVNGGADQRTAGIWGSRMGRDYVNLGLGGTWKLDNRGDKFLFVNYDAKLYDRATLHLGEAGFVRKW